MDDYIWFHLLMGPMLLLLSLLLMRFPPRRINYFIGYRTARSMKSQQARIYANWFSSRYMACVATATIAVQLVFSIWSEDKLAMKYAAGFIVIASVSVVPALQTLRRVG
jgi:uncharacterized membrane protein